MKQQANEILSTLDSAANTIERLAASGKIQPKIAAKLVYDIDSFADRFQVAAFGEQSLRNHQAKVIRRDPDEPYMDTFENPQKVLRSDPDEPYMHRVEKSFNSEARYTFDDKSSNVNYRKEYDIRDLNPYAGGTKPQPSWNGPRGGESVRSASQKRWSK